jgi:hypothetical protein
MHVLESLDDSALDAMALSIEELRRSATKATSEQSPTPLESGLEPPVLTAPSMEGETLTPAAASGTQSEAHRNQLFTVLKEQVPLSTSTIYSAKNPRGDEFTIEISSGIVNEDSGPERHTIRRLLKSIFHGTGGKSGIKLLSDIGPNIIELKAYVAGHKRLIGCLEGRKLRLLKYGSMPDTRAGYAREIPANLCQ